jgi:putative restriction endonuclease
MKFWVGVTDNSWFSYLSQAVPDEVNFWQPRGGATYAKLEPGTPFLFKLKHPHHHIAGGGYFVKSTSLPLSIAWEAFGFKNGAAHRQVFERMIRSLVTDPTVRDPEIGCTVLAQPFFWPRQAWIPDPIEFSANIVRGRYYDTSDAAGAQLWTEAQSRLDALFNASSVADSPAQERYGAPVPIRPRLGQGAFRVIVTDAYQRRCALTGESTLPVLEAAHIQPYAQSGPHDLANGLLLRSDFHKLFDIGLITVTTDHRIEVSPRIREEWSNGKAYYRLHGQPLARLPEHPDHRPGEAYLRWHNEHRYVG